MELGLSLGNRGVVETNNMGFCMGLGLKGSSNYSSSSPSPSPSDQKLRDEQDDDETERREKVGSTSSSPPSPPPPPPPRRLQLDLLPLSPVPRPSQPPPPLRFPWLADNISTEPASSDGPGTTRTMDVNRRPTVVEEQSSPNSGTSSFMEFSLYNNGGVGGINGENGNNYGQLEVVMMGVTTTTTTTSRGSDHDDEENIGSARKKLRLSKEQSAFLEESFKEHHTLNPKQKLALANQLNLRPRQVEVWFQNRRARTKLKQTEVDCEYLKRCCETLTEDNRRLQKELQELRALKSSQPFFMHLPATTLTMCPSCERVAPTSTSTSVSATTVAAAAKHAVVGSGSVTLSLGKPEPMLPFSNAQAQAQAHKASP